MNRFHSSEPKAAGVSVGEKGDNGVQSPHEHTTSVSNSRTRVRVSTSLILFSDTPLTTLVESLLSRPDLLLCSYLYEQLGGHGK